MTTRFHLLTLRGGVLLLCAPTLLLSPSPAEAQASAIPTCFGDAGLRCPLDATVAAGVMLAGDVQHDQMHYLPIAPEVSGGIGLLARMSNTLFLGGHLGGGSILAPSADGDGQAYTVVGSLLAGGAAAELVEIFGELGAGAAWMPALDARAVLRAAFDVRFGPYEVGGGIGLGVGPRISFIVVMPSADDVPSPAAMLTLGIRGAIEGVSSAAGPEPTQPERCNGRDDDHDGRVDEGVTIAGFADADGDGFGDPATPRSVCEDERGFSERAGDCDDTQEATHPDATEICDGIDNDCDGAPDDGESCPSWQVRFATDQASPFDTGRDTRVSAARLALLARPILGEIADYLAEAPEALPIVIQAAADPRLDDDHNLWLSHRRRESVRDAIVEALARRGVTVSPSRFRIEALGETAPLLRACPDGAGEDPCVPEPAQRAMRAAVVSVGRPPEAPPRFEGRAVFFDEHADLEPMSRPTIDAIAAERTGDGVLEIRPRYDARHETFAIGEARGRRLHAALAARLEGPARVVVCHATPSDLGGGGDPARAINRRADVRRVTEEACQ